MAERPQGLPRLALLAGRRRLSLSLPARRGNGPCRCELPRPRGIDADHLGERPARAFDPPRRAQPLPGKSDDDPGCHRPHPLAGLATVAKAGEILPQARTATGVRDPLTTLSAHLVFKALERLAIG